MRKFMREQINKRRKDHIDKENGVSIKIDSWGWEGCVYVNGKKRKDLTMIEDFKARFSKYCDWEEWAEKETDVSEGELSKESIFLYTGVIERLPFTNCFNSFTYCQSPEFAAGYLLFVVLGMVAEFLGLTDKEYEEYLKLGVENKDITRVPIVTELIELCRKNGCDEYNIADKVMHIQRLCNSVFYEQNVEKKKEYLTYAAEKFNEYFEYAIEEQTGWNFEFRVYYGADAVKEVLPEYLPPDSSQEVKKTLEKPVWDEADRELIQEAIDYII